MSFMFWCFNPWAIDITLKRYIINYNLYIFIQLYIFFHIIDMCSSWYIWVAHFPILEESNFSSLLYIVIHCCNSSLTISHLILQNCICIFLFQSFINVLWYVFLNLFYFLLTCTTLPSPCYTHFVFVSLNILCSVSYKYS